MEDASTPPSPTQGGDDTAKRRRGPVRRSKKGGWTKEEDEILREAVKEFNGRSWKKIAERLPNRTNVQCLHRWQKVLNPELVKGPWTEEEDQKIIELVKKHGCENWSLIANNLDGRIGKQCRERYFNQLDPSIKKTPWTEEEKRILMDSQAKMGNKWAEISKILVGRPNNQCKNMYHSIMAKRRKANKKSNGKTKSSTKSTNRKARDISDDDEDDYDTNTVDDHVDNYATANSTSTPTSNLSPLSNPTNNMTIPSTTTAPLHNLQPPGVTNLHATQRFLRSNPKRGHHRSYSDSAVLHFQNMIGQQPPQGTTLPQGTNPTDFPNPNTLHQMQFIPSDFATQQSMYLQQQQQLQLQMRQMRLNQQHQATSSGFGSQPQNIPHHLSNDQLGTHMVGIAPAGAPQNDMAFSSSAPTDNIDSLMSDIMNDPITQSFDQDLDHNRRRSSSMFVTSNTRTSFEGISHPMEPKDDLFMDIPKITTNADDLLDFDLGKEEPDKILDGDMNDDPMMEDTKDFELDDMEVLSPDTTPLDSLLESPKHFRMRGHQRSQSFDPRMLSGHRFQPF
mmetsp:Transcript_3218/g.12292  ORF Transcript_3218/g.12292 Transcript_3218/m.12292 type:complete len:562 (-) Transcript_3218:290-1975(-)|eukprot:CAMPEP_0117443236 /NCGR_PEP_ID=MMETSP0759-20121206/4587_1 /TAXON_ID=63605 /ORGANISM="Percolomonas cosmopolitus, Strain WS" /LENGTH=561 /DNA_ID=CAMNT_0005235197 /DNA_START=760 /DNA_END=2445 /DNA_ORIENTATION=+